MKTQMTVPWPKAWDTTKTKRLAMTTMPPVPAAEATSDGNSGLASMAFITAVKAPP